MLIEDLQSYIRYLMTQETCKDIASKLGKSESWVTNQLKTPAPDAIRIDDELERGLLKYGAKIIFITPDGDEFIREWNNACRKLNPKKWGDET